MQNKNQKLELKHSTEIVI